MKYLKKEDNIPSDYVFLSNNFYYKKNDSILKYNLKVEYLYIDVNESFAFEFFKYKFLIRTRDSLRIYEGNNLEYEITFDKSNIRQTKLFNNHNILIRENDNDNWSLYYYLSGKLIWKKEWIEDSQLFVINESYFLSKNENYLSFCNLWSGEVLWKLDVSKLGEYLHLKGTEHEELRVGTVHELYTYNAILVALLRNDTIIGIDSATGDVLWQKPLFLFISRPVQLNDKLYHIITGVDVKNMLQVYDLATGKLEREVEITHQVLKENTFFTKRFINDTYIALTATKTGEILVINHKTEIVEDYAKLPNLKEKIPIDNIPQVHQNKVYQLDGEGTLYILEKEE
ncbi:PQQ-binding-like beta-propeller repeat protein [Cellulophaga lytica]|uniref:Pyrrolo-quinoline quinone repeat-containing protein n=1 Tax=Cellulophaga lytica (strain ATCC 23178 / DSM 7489 / JCM 8516 / NBRC 14961 / NCIMB 1423 / VKM B-1433 / Cy l20) TaxID=867900 RepID=F0RCX7_CELLC|nr:PQQ-binding-like beta-propeller repeat protein [Cellulophaga lytica]ADY28664.1 hypothetical protein Celly_0832 [Cellulophaga lytica DSM 7489]WQG77157.1 PQQ-binding-like beta-propeller repeat protein [Cellulophaga lytica]